MSIRHWLLAAAVYAAGMLTLLGSSVTDEDDDDSPSIPTIIAFTMSTPSNADLELNRGVSASEPLNVLITNLRLSGEFEKQSGDLILNTDALELDTSSFIEFDLSGEVTGSGRMEITQLYRRETENNPEPDFGQYSILFEGDTTTLTAQGGDGALIDTPTQSSQAFSWMDLEDQINDADTDVNIRVAALMESLMIFTVDLAEISENIQRSFVDNSDLLEAAGPGESIDFDCLNSNDNGQDALQWSLDTNSNDVPDGGDEFVRFFVNCQDTATRYFNGDIAFNGYDFDESSSLRNLEMVVEYSSLRILSESFTAGLPTTDENPQADGSVRYRYDQIAETTP